jgi:hypothetical protein
MRFSLYVVIFALTSCKNEKNVEQAKVENAPTTISVPSSMGDTTQAVVAISPKSIPDPCALLNQVFIEDAIGSALNSFTIKSGNIGSQTSSRSCFFRWVTSSNPNEGIMLQIMNNSLSSDAPNYPTLFIESKIKDGDQAAYGGQVAKYQSWNELGDGGAASHEKGVYHWRIANDYIFMLAFNNNMSASQRNKLAQKIGKEIMKNFAENSKI